MDEGDDELAIGVASALKYVKLARREVEHRREALMEVLRDNGEILTFLRASRLKRGAEDDTPSKETKTSNITKESNKLEEILAKAKVASGQTSQVERPIQTPRKSASVAPTAAQLYDESRELRRLLHKWRETRSGLPASWLDDRSPAGESAREARRSYYELWAAPGAGTSKTEHRFKPEYEQAVTHAVASYLDTHLSDRAIDDLQRDVETASEANIRERVVAVYKARYRAQRLSSVVGTVLGAICPPGDDTPWPPREAPPAPSEADAFEAILLAARQHLPSCAPITFDGAPAPAALNPDLGLSLAAGGTPPSSTSAADSSTSAASRSRELSAHGRAYQEAVEAVVLGATHRHVGFALLPPLLAKLKSIVGRCLTAEKAGHGSTSKAPPGRSEPVAIEEWKSALRAWRTAEAILVNDGKPATSFVRRADHARF
jgi:hypothetical protein